MASHVESWPRFHDWNLNFQLLWVPDIVCIKKCDKIACRSGPSTISGNSGTDIRFIAVDQYRNCTVFGFRPCSQSGLIGTFIVYDDDFLGVFVEVHFVALSR
jgi:hypothetical protein